MKLLSRFLCAALLLVACATNAEDNYPSKPIRILVTLSAGSQVDVLARLVGDRLGQSLGKPIIVENKPGAGGTIAAAQVASATADGYTLLMTSNAHVINPSLYDHLRFDTVRDFRGVSLIAVVPSVLVTSRDFPAKSAADLIKTAKAMPNELTYGSPGVGSAGHMATELFNLNAGLKALHVPYKGTPEALTDLIGNRVNYFFAPLGSALPFIKEGKIKALGVSTAERSTALPDVPTVAASGLPGFQYEFWYGLLAPAQTPKPIVERLASEIQKALALPEMQEKLASQGAITSQLTTEKFDQFIHADMRRSADLISLSGAKHSGK